MAIVKRNKLDYPAPPGQEAATPKASSAAAPAPQPPQVPPPASPPQAQVNTAPPSGWSRPAPAMNFGQQLMQGAPNFAATSGPAAPPPPVANAAPNDPFQYKGGKVGDSHVFNNPAANNAAPGPNPAAPENAGSIFQAQDKLGFIKAHPEQFDDSISPEQWQAWINEGTLDSGCPGRKPFRTGRPGPGGQQFSGAERCVEKPDDCPEGYRVIGNGGNAKCLPGDAPEFRGGPGGGAGSGAGPGGMGGSGGGGGYGTPGNFNDVDATLRDLIMGNLKGQNSRYTPEAIQTLLGQTKATAEDQRQQAADQITEDAAARGVLGAGATGTALANAAIAANRTVAGEQANINRAKIDADFEDKRAAMSDAFNYLNAARDWAYKQQMTAMQRQQFDANLQLAYARMQQEWDQMQAEAGYRFLDGGL